MYKREKSLNIRAMRAVELTKHVAMIEQMKVETTLKFHNKTIFVVTALDGE